ncbi:MAG TPA: DUF2975 domain-containing protein [Sphingomicrobium sp.]|nr:DUF2975 domain-containing protein [Sphingomicrobium sp.]
MSNQPSTALPVAYVVLRLLIVLNWIYGACILALLIFSFVNEPFLLRALKLGSVGENPGLVIGIRAIAALGILAVPLNLALLKRLVAMVGTVRVGDPFVASNAYRLNAIAWLLLGQQLLSLAIGLIAKAVSTPAHPLHVDAGFSPGGWLAVILTFVLARVFAEGTLMREDLEGTV